ncbi:hypothetical protein Tco_0155830 [Tanacetum coccineum]
MRTDIDLFKLAAVQLSSQRELKRKLKKGLQESLSRRELLQQVIVAMSGNFLPMYLIPNRRTCFQSRRNDLVVKKFRRMNFGLEEVPENDFEVVEGPGRSIHQHESTPHPLLCSG